MTTDTTSKIQVKIQRKRNKFDAQMKANSQRGHCLDLWEVWS